MEQSQTIKKKRSKPIYMISGLLIGFCFFIFLLTRPSTEAKALDELESCYSIDNVRSCWNNYRNELHDNNKFVTKVRQKLSSMRLSEAEILQCKDWLPKPPQSLNLIVIPDLSKRIIDHQNNPDQVKIDTVILWSIFNSFVNLTKSKTDSKDRLMIDVTDEDQASGNFRLLANDLVFDLSTHHHQVNRLFFNKEQGRFKSGIEKLYAEAQRKPIGADYWYYFNRHLPKKIQKSTLFDDYRNVLILITDGYLEAQNNFKTGTTFYTGSYSERYAACEQMKHGKSIDASVNATISKIRDCQSHFPDLEILVVEVSERKGRSRQESRDPGTPCDYDIMKTLWTDWFETLEIKNSKSNFFLQRNDATSLTTREITNFLKGT